MELSLWDQDARLYRYYKMAEGRIRIRQGPRTGEWLGFHDVTLHAEGSAILKGEGKEARGVVVNSIQEVIAADASCDDDGFDVADFAVGFAAASGLRWLMGKVKE